MHDSHDNSSDTRHRGEATPRLQVVLSRAGVDSRRHAASIIREGRVEVNGVVVREPGEHIDPARDSIRVDGRLVDTRSRPRTRTILLYKPRGLLCSSTDDLGPTVFECLRGVRERVVCCGRLDKDSEGLLLLTNDGDVALRLTHPRYGHSKEYAVTVRGAFDGATLRALRSIRTLEDDGTPVRPVEVEVVDSDPSRSRHLLRMTLHEGRNRQIRRMCEQVGLRVERLVRTAVDGLRLPRDMMPGDWRDLAPRECARLLSPKSNPHPATE